MTGGRLPNLLIVGVPKAGTTSLFDYLAQHPDICGADEKEIGYFNHYHPLHDRSRGAPPIESYAAHFAHCTGQRYALEATPSYSYGGQAVIDAIRSVLGTPKVILTLRNPTDRLWSAYTFQRSLGNIPSIRSFDQYLEVCLQRREDGVDRLETSRLQGLAIGFYGEYVPTWLDAFERDAHIIFAEDLIRKRARVLEGIFDWLEIDSRVTPALDLDAKNVTAHARSPQVANVVYRLKRAADRWKVIPGPVRDRLRRAYLRVNTGTMPERLNAETRERVEAIYRASNAATARAMIAHGYRNLPAWLAAESA